MAGTQHEAARPKGGHDLDDAPTAQPMRPAARGRIGRNPSAEDKRVRRANMRKSAEYVPGHVDCQSCGATDHPVLGDGTAPSCSHCGSYSIRSTRPGSADREYTPVRYLNREEHGLAAEGTKTATVLDTEAWKLNPGDHIKMPNGRTMKVNRVRQHETSGSHVYVDTDGGTALVKRTDPFSVVPRNSQQQSLPGYGTPGGNSNHLPFDPQSSGSNESPSTQCPTCGSKGTLIRQGDHYSCSRCGYREQFGGAGGYAFTNSPSVVKTFSTINGNTQSVIARRAQQVLDQEDSQ